MLASQSVPVEGKIEILLESKLFATEAIMARRKLSLQEQLKGVLAAIRSKRTPPQLRQGLERRRDSLEKLIRSSRSNFNNGRYTL